MTSDPSVIAHRGASGRWAEHTRAAYLQAIDDGADGLECDVQLTADRVLVCWHDATVDRTSDGHGRLHEFTWAQLRALDVATWKDGNLPGAWGQRADQLLTLADLVRIALEAGRRLMLAIEFKHDEHEPEQPVPAGLGPGRYDAEDAALAVLRDAGWDPRTGRLGTVSVTFMSFDPGSMRHLAATVPAESLMVLTESALVDVGAAQGVGPSVAVVAADPGAVRAWVEAGLRVRVWTVDDAGDLDRCRAVGVHEVTTNYPARVRSLLAARLGDAGSGEREPLEPPERRLEERGPGAVR